jgi:hypothetical protein
MIRPKILKKLEGSSKNRRRPMKRRVRNCLRGLRKEKLRNLEEFRRVFL